MEKITFLKNYNSKLFCKSFIDVRKEKLDVMQKYKIFHCDYEVGDAVILSRKKLKLNELNEFISQLAFGRNVEDAKTILNFIYENSDENDDFYLYLFSFVE
jgi:hypothetical protein